MEDEKKPGRLQTLLSSEKTMPLVNVLFCLSLLIRHPLLTYSTLLLWLAFLLLSVRHAESRAQRILYGALALLPLTALLVNLYFTLFSPR